MTSDKKFQPTYTKVCESPAEYAAKLARLTARCRATSGFGVMAGKNNLPAITHFVTGNGPHTHQFFGRNPELEERMRIEKILYASRQTLFDECQYVCSLAGVDFDLKYFSSSDDDFKNIWADRKDKKISSFIQAADLARWECHHAMVRDVARLMKFRGAQTTSELTGFLKVIWEGDLKLKALIPTHKSIRFSDNQMSLDSFSEFIFSSPCTLRSFRTHKKFWEGQLKRYGIK